MSGSAAERAIRDHAAARLREMLPEARIIHELVVGGCRADLAAVTTERITLVEIKSQRDTLSRLPEQVRQFERSSHDTVIAADERWFDRTPYHNGSPRFVPCDELQAAAGSCDVWAYPELPTRPLYGTWKLPRHWSARPEPHAARLLQLCWRAELLEEARAHQISCGSRTSSTTLVRDMAWHMTGAEVARAVCGQLRQRSFPEADAAIAA